MEVTDEMVEEAYRKLSPATMAFGPGYLKHVIRHALTAAIAVAYKNDIPPHKTFIALNERVAKLEQRIDDTNGMEERVSRIEGKLNLYTPKVESLHQKIDTHIHHNINADHTGLAIYPVGKVEADDVRWRQVNAAWYDTDNDGGHEDAKAAIDKAVELGLVSRREPVVVTDEDIYTAIESFDGAPGAGFDSGIRAALQSFADRINRKNHA